MGLESIESFEYKGHKIDIVYDYDYPESPNDWDDNVQLVHCHRDFYIESDVASEDKLREIMESTKMSTSTHYVFPTKAYIHSGVHLSLYESGRVYPDEQWDVSVCGAVFVSKKEANNRKKAYKIAQGFIDTWNYINSGQVYGYSIDDGEGDSCYGFIGEADHCIDEAKSIVDYMVENERKQRLAHTKAMIKNRVPLASR